MTNKISIEDSIYVAGHNGMAGSAICRSLKKFGYKNINMGGALMELVAKGSQDIFLTGNPSVSYFRNVYKR